MINVGKAVGYLTLDTVAFSNNLTSAQAQLKETANAATNIGSKFTSVGQSMTSVGRGLTLGLTTPIVGAGAAIVKTAYDFEKQMSRVKAISGASEESFSALEKKAREMGESTIYSATESAEALEYMALAGWKDEEMLRGIEPILKLAGAAQMDLGRASDIVTDNLTAFRMSVNEATRFVDVMAATMTNSNTDVEMLGESFKYVAPMAGQLGYSIEDVSLALGIMANSGIKSSQAGTSLRRMLINLVDPTTEVQTAMNNLGVRLFDAQGKAKPLRSILEDLRKSLYQGGGDTESFRKGVKDLSEQLEAGVIDEEEYNIGLLNLAKSSGVVTDQFKLQNIEAISGAIGMSGLASVVGASEQEWKTLASAIDNSNGAASKMYDTMTDNLWGSFQELKSMLSEVALELAEILIPVIKDVVNAIKGWVEWFKNLDDWQKELITKVLAFTATIGPLLLIGGKLTSGIGNIISLFGRLIPKIGGVGSSVVGLSKTVTTGAGIFSNFGGIVKGIGSTALTGLKTGITALGGAFTSIGGVVSGVASTAFGGLSTALGAVGSGITGFISMLGGPLTLGIAAAAGGIGLLIANWDTVVDVVGKAGEAISNWAKDVGKKIADWAGDVGEFFGNAFDNIKKWGSNVIENISEFGGNIVKNVGDFFSKVPEKAEEFFGSAFNRIKDWGGNIINTVGEFGGKVVDNVGSFFGQIPDKVSNFFGTAFDTVKEWGGNVVETVKEAGGNVVENVGDFFSKVPEKIGGFFEEAFDNVKTVGGNIVEKVSEFGEGVVKNIGDFFGQIPDKIGGFFGSAFDKIKEWGSGVLDQASKVGQGFLDSIGGFFGQIPDAIGNFFNSAVEAGSNIVNGIGQGLMNAGETIWNGITTVGSNIVDGFKNFFGIKSPSRLMAKVIGVFLPPGIAQGFESAMPKAIKSMKSDLSDGMDELEEEVDDIDVEPELKVKDSLEYFTNSLKNVYDDIANWFESVDERISDSILSMTEKFENLINLSKDFVMTPNEGLFGINNFNKTTSSQTQRDIKTIPSGNVVNNFTFNTNEPINEIEASRLLKKTAQDIAEGFIY